MDIPSLITYGDSTSITAAPYEHHDTGFAVPTVPSAPDSQYSGTVNTTCISPSISTVAISSNSSIMPTCHSLLFQSVSVTLPYESSANSSFENLPLLHLQCSLWFRAEPRGTQTNAQKIPMREGRLRRGLHREGFIDSTPTRTSWRRQANILVFLWLHYPTAKQFPSPSGKLPTRELWINSMSTDTGLPKPTISYIHAVTNLLNP